MPLLTLHDFEETALDALTAFGAVPSLSPMFDTNWAENGHLNAAAELLASWARARQLASFDVTIHRLPGRTPTLVVTVDSTAGDGATVVLYGHLDKQPPLGDWSEGLDPFAPVRRGDRLYARGVSDDGYALFSALSAIEAMEANNIPHGRCVVLIEASEESGSPDLAAYLDALADHLGDVELLICLDSGALTYDRLWVTTSLRGMVNVEVTVQVLEQGQHSGSVSGVVPSSFRVLRQLLDRVEDSSTGEVLVEEMWATIPAADTKSAHDIAQEFGDVIADDLPLVEGVTLMGSSAEERLLRRTWYPTLSVIGMGGLPSPDIAGNVLRPFTTAVLSFRLPPSIDADVAGAAVVRMLTIDPPSNARITVKIDSSGDGWVAPTLAPWLEPALEQASLDAFGRTVGFTGEGGSIPFLSALAKRYPGVQFVATGVGGPHSNAHAIDEMLDLPTAVGVTNAVITVLKAHATK
ncbi:MAG TPA: M20/M25/M40 family metallo-hydrolase [Acidimicrobiales bacterium]|jgi:acetylornithine deacetylase/succinyl-diaminopimelate desuccinylase-like protein|nr:M20/M25/M40 family metallo-hydrolase [Acidimicrobiales bacterium]